MSAWAGDKLLGLWWIGFSVVMVFAYFFYWPVTLPLTIWILILLGINFIVVNEIVLVYVKVMRWIIVNGVYGQYRRLKCKIMKQDCEDMDVFII